MITLYGAKFSERDLKGLDRLQCVLAFAYNDQKKMDNAYDSILMSLGICRNLEIAQSNLNLVINLIESYVDLLNFTESIKNGKGFIGEIHKVYIELLEETLKSLKEDQNRSDLINDDCGDPIVSPNLKDNGLLLLKFTEKSGREIDEVFEDWAVEKLQKKLKEKGWSNDEECI